MKVVKNYKDIIKFDSKIQNLLFQKLHNKHFSQKLKSLTTKHKTVYIDSGATPNKNTFVFENFKWKNVIKQKNIKFYKDFYSNTMAQSINKYIKPDVVVFENSEEFKYITPNKLKHKIKIISAKYDAKLFICIDTVFLDFNKVKYTNDFIIKDIIKPKLRSHKIDNFKYVIEVNQ